MVGMTFEPTEDQVLIRTRERVSRLRAAIKQEESKTQPSQERIEKLNKEINRRVTRVRELLKGVI